MNGWALDTLQAAGVQRISWFVQRAQRAKGAKGIQRRKKGRTRCTKDLVVESKEQREQESKGGMGVEGEPKNI
jgi:hypothetical protein